MTQIVLLLASLLPTLHAAPSLSPTETLPGLWLSACESNPNGSSNGGSYRKELTVTGDGSIVHTEIFYKDAQCVTPVTKSTQQAKYTITSTREQVSMVRLVSVFENSKAKPGDTLEASVRFTLSADQKSLTTQLISGRVLTSMGPAQLDPKSVNSLLPVTYFRK